MLSHSLAPRFEAQVSDRRTHGPVARLDKAPSQSQELSLLMRLFRELQDLPAIEVDAGLSHLLNRLSQLLHAAQVSWHLNAVSVVGAMVCRSSQVWPSGVDSLGNIPKENNDGQVISQTVHIDHITHMVFGLYRHDHMPCFSAQDETILGCALSGLHRWLHWLALSRGASMISPPLPDHLRKVLLQLLTGQSEKQIASTMGVSTNTSHQYITALYRAFGVRNRASLMSMWVSQKISSASIEHSVQTPEWVSWFNHQRLLEPVDLMSSAEANFDCQLACQASTMVEA